MTPAKKVKIFDHEEPTYRAGLLHAHSYRILRKHATDELSIVDLTTLDWSLLGLLYHQKKGHRSSILARLLGIDAPLVTATARKLMKKGYITEALDAKDLRAKILKLTAKGRGFVPLYDRILCQRLNLLLVGATKKDFSGYIHILETILKNSKPSDL